MHSSMPPHPFPPLQTNTHYKTQNYQERKQVTFDPKPMVYTDLFNYLIFNHSSPETITPMLPCGFHAEAVGHTVEDCKAFKYVVQDLIDAKWMTFKQEGPSVATNPLSGHDAPATNAIDDLAGQSLIRTIGCIQTPLEVIHAELCKFEVIGKGCAQKEMCADPHCVGACEAFKPIRQDLLDRHIVQVGVQKEEENVLTFQSDKNRGDQKPIDVPYSQNSKSTMVKPKSVLVQVPAPFLYKKDSAVPWNYGVQMQMKNPQAILDITNIVGSSGITRSGRVYVPEVLREGPSKEDEGRTWEGKGARTYGR